MNTLLHSSNLNRDSSILTIYWCFIERDRNIVVLSNRDEFSYGISFLGQDQYHSKRGHRCVKKQDDTLTLLTDCAIVDHLWRNDVSYKK